MQDKKARFRCGQLCTTPAALDKVGRAGLTQLLERHLSGDWGDTCESDARANEEALRSGIRYVYHSITPAHFIEKLPKILIGENKERTHYKSHILL